MSKLQLTMSGLRSVVVLKHVLAQDVNDNGLIGMFNKISDDAYRLISSSRQCGDFVYSGDLSIKDVANLILSNEWSILE